MFKFLKDSVRELKHVVWPTREETKNYFITVVVVLVLFGVYLFVASTLFTKGLFGLKDFVNGKASNEVVEKNIETKKIDLKTISAETTPTIKVTSVKTEEIKKEEIVKETIGTEVSK